MTIKDYSAVLIDVPELRSQSAKGKRQTTPGRLRAPSLTWKRLNHLMQLEDL